ncbi:MAG: hypothetical protein O2788_01355 [Chloroflexi bacterium]|nr:hypothetical protein [Chloroflexota bacterium]
MDRTTLNRVSHVGFHGSAVRFADTPAADAGVAARYDKPPAGQQAAVGAYFDRDFIAIITKWMVDAPHILGFGIALVTVLVIARVIMRFVRMTVRVLLAIPV